MAKRRDNFGALRLAAATAVLVSHGFGLTGRTDPVWPLAGQMLGDVAVAVFFAISGFLVVGSWCRDPNLRRFAGRRARRIWPGLTAAVLITAYVIGPLFTGLPLTHYLTSGGPQDYVAGKLLMLPVDPRLPGVFTSNPLAAANSSLWTLPVEVKAYVLVAVLGLLGAFRRRWCVWAAWLLCVELVVLSAKFNFGSVAGFWPRETYLFAVFLGGAVLYRERERIPLRAGLAAALIAVWLLSSGTPAQVPMGAAAIPYACLWLAYRTRPVLVRLVERADLSYGIYLYSYPVEQGIRAALGRAATPLVTIALALPITVALAFGSWELVEKRWLRRGRPRDLSPAEPASSVLVAPAETRVS